MLTNEPVRHAIAAGVRTAQALGWQRPAVLRSVNTHPNRNMLVADLNTYVLPRQTMDPSQGEGGYVRFVVRAGSGPEAVAIVNESVAAINEPFIKRARKDRRAA